jgi:hypothetical protein
LLTILENGDHALLFFPVVIMKFSNLQTSPKRKRQESPEKQGVTVSHSVDQYEMSNDPNQLVKEFISLKQNQVLTSKDAEIVDQILKGQLNRDQVMLLAKPQLRTKRVKITKRPVHYRGVGLSTFKQVKRPVPALSHKRVKSNPSSETAKTILDALDKPDSTDLKNVDFLPNPYAIDVPAVTISPANSPAKSNTMDGTVSQRNPFENTNPKNFELKGRDVMANNESSKRIEKVSFIFTPKKSTIKEPVFTTEFKPQGAGISEVVSVSAEILKPNPDDRIVFTPIKGSHQMSNTPIRASTTDSQPGASPKSSGMVEKIPFSQQIPNADAPSSLSIDERPLTVPEYFLFDLVSSSIGRNQIPQIYLRTSYNPPNSRQLFL